MFINPIHCIDFYKAGHIKQYPPETTYVYSNLTARSAKHANVLPDFDNKVVFFGLQYFIKDFLIECFDKNFFDRNVDDVCRDYQKLMDASLGKDCVGTSHIRKLHELGYLPLKIKALPEGSRVPIGVPLLTITNTHPDFFWLVNYIESVMSCYLWKAITSATTAYEYRRLLHKFAGLTCENFDFVKYQAHDFSLRGMSSLQDAVVSGAAHLTSFLGTDSVPSIDFLEQYYGANHEADPVGVSVPATEHSVMCMGGMETEIETFKRLINDTYPSGIVSIVSDTWDFWRVLTEYMPQLKNKIMLRDGKVVIRPDSGDPIKIILGDNDADIGSPEYKGAVQCLWEVFGGTINEKGFKELDPHIGLIYGDSITLERAQVILQGLYDKGFASSNIVFGVGSFTYQYVTRDSFGFAIKATSGVVNDTRKEIFKNPKTDNGTKKSAKGLLRVDFVNGEYVLFDQQKEHQEEDGALDVVFVGGKFHGGEENLEGIRYNIDKSIKKIFG